MSISVLVVSSTPGFRSLLQQTLEDSGRYLVQLTDTPQEAMELAGKAFFALGIVDIADGDSAAIRELCHALRRQIPSIRLVIVPPNNDPQSPIMAEVRPDGYLTKPFYLPDLLDTLDEVMQTRLQGMMDSGQLAQPGQTGLGPEAPTWLADVNRAAQYLARLSLESASQAALIIRQGELWAYAGELPQIAAQELSQTVAQYWSGGGSSDLARFVRLAATQGEYMLYATRLVGNMVLTLVFDVETPFSKIRSQASRLARALASPPASEINGLTQGAKSDLSPAERVETGPVPTDLPPLFDDVPPPFASGWGSRSLSAFAPFDVSGSTREDVPDTQEEQDQERNFPGEPSVWEPEMGWDNGGLPNQEKASFPDPMADTRPVLVSQVSAESLSDGPEVLSDETIDYTDLQPASAAVCNLNYACVLIPRLPQHHLTGELGAHLNDWVTQLCLAFGWRLQHLAVRPQYLLWIVDVSPTVSPSYLVRMMRQHTSQRIFTYSAELEKENPSGDFWAPGYLVMSGSQPPPVSVMQNFIQQTRQRQGVGKSTFSSR